MLDMLEILCTHFSHNQKLKEEKNFFTIVADIQRAWKILKMRKLILEGEMVISYAMAISKIVFQSFIKFILKHIINKLKKLQNAFSRNISSPKIKHGTLCNDYKAGRLKNVDIPNKIIAL